MPKKDKKIGGLLIAGGCLIGLGIGMYYSRPDVGVLIGLGIGFIAAFIEMKMR